MHQEKWGWFTEAAIFPEHKRTIDARRWQFKGGNKKRSAWLIPWTSHSPRARLCMHLQGRTQSELLSAPSEGDRELGLRGGGAVRLEIRRWGSAGIKQAA